MNLLSEMSATEIEVCPYLHDRPSSQNCFLADAVTDAELEDLLSQGWRKFGPYFFRPACPGCRDCIPVRVPVHSFLPSKSQRRLLRKNVRTQARFGDLQFTEEIFRIYQDHSRFRFGKEVSAEEMFNSFYMPSCPGLQSEYYVDDELAAAGILDRSSRSLSSVYFMYAEKYKHLGLGNFSILAEIDYAAKIGLTYYYLGFYIAKNSKMAYKGRFFPQERFNWEKGVWMLDTD